MATLNGNYGIEDVRNALQGTFGTSTEGRIAIDYGNLRIGIDAGEDGSDTLVVSKFVREGSEDRLVVLGKWKLERA